MANIARIGLVVNPKAGLGGRVGLKGSDGSLIQRQALEMGAVPQASARAAAALSRLKFIDSPLELITWAGAMGEEAARLAGLKPIIAGGPADHETLPEDTMAAVRKLAALEARLIIFVGGDGTARNVYDGLGLGPVVLGVPAGVKMHSAVFGLNPARSGDLAGDFASGRVRAVRPAEVMDLDEDEVRRDRVQPRLYGYLTVPFSQGFMQSQKRPSPAAESAVQADIARRIVAEMEPDRYYILGPGTTTMAVKKQLNVPGTLVGVDVVRNKALVARDADEQALLKITRSGPAQIVVTPIGGQGILFGRGNQQISPAVLQRVGLKNVIVAATPEKLLALGGHPLFMDLGDSAFDKAETTHLKIITGARDQVIYRLSY